MSLWGEKILVQREGLDSKGFTIKNLDARLPNGVPVCLRSGRGGPDKRGDEVYVLNDRDQLFQLKFPADAFSAPEIVAVENPYPSYTYVRELNGDLYLLNKEGALFKSAPGGPQPVPEFSGQRFDSLSEAFRIDNLLPDDIE